MPEFRLKFVVTTDIPYICWQVCKYGDVVFEQYTNCHHKCHPDRPIFAKLKPVAFEESYLKLKVWFSISIWFDNVGLQLDSCPFRPSLPLGDQTTSDRYPLQWYFWHRWCTDIYSRTLTRKTISNLCLLVICRSPTPKIPLLQKPTSTFVSLKFKDTIPKSMYFLRSPCGI